MSFELKPLGCATWLLRLRLGLGNSAAAPKFMRLGEKADSSAAKMGEASSAEGRRSSLPPRCFFAAGMHTSTDPRSDALAGAKSMRGAVELLAGDRCAADERWMLDTEEELRLERGCVMRGQM